MRAEHGRIQKYLERYACPEVAMASEIATEYLAVLVVPVFRESPGFLDNYRSAFAEVGGRALLVVVVNAAEPGDSQAQRDNAALLESLRRPNERAVSTSPPAWLVPWRERNDCLGDILVIDRASAEFRLPRGEGVGLARKIGCDVALALWFRGKLEQPWLYCTDADATLPSNYFAREVSPKSTVSVRLFEFEHVSGKEGSGVDEATSLYEVSLRYLVLSLAHAGSPYAYHSVGSTLAVHAEAYAAVRGFPRRLAGEDFHLLNKLAKVGPVALEAAPLPGERAAIQLSSRTSSRTIHGTGVAVTELLADPQGRRSLLYDPRIFQVLKDWLSLLGEFTIHRDLPRIRRQLEVWPDGARISQTLESLGCWDALRGAADGTRTAAVLARRSHEWFDALKTVRWIHELQAALYPPIPWREALCQSEWCSPVSEQWDACRVCELLRAVERTTPRLRGPSHAIGPTGSSDSKLLRTKISI